LVVWCKASAEDKGSEHMPIQQGIWKIGSKPEPVKRVVLESEAILDLNKN
jgi:hypothetical protein